MEDVLSVNEYKRIKYDYISLKLLKACQLTYNKYSKLNGEEAGKRQLYGALKNGMFGNFRSFSDERDENGKVIFSNKKFLKSYIKESEIIYVYDYFINKYSDGLTVYDMADAITTIVTGESYLYDKSAKKM